MSDIRPNPHQIPRQQQTMQKPTTTVKNAYQYKKVVGYILLVIIVLLAGWFLLTGRDQGSLTDNYHLQDGWQAVFLNNGETYFGKVSAVNSEVLVLESVYYLQSQQKLQTGNQPKEGEIGLVKLGSEIHGPQSQMIIPKTSISYIENLKENSSIVRAIVNSGK